MGVYIQLPVVGIQLEIPDYVVSETILKRRARLITMTYNLKAKYFALGWQVGYYENLADGSYGAPIEQDGITSYSKETVADNTVMVDVTNGQVVLPDEEGNYPVDYTGQYDYINNLLETTPVMIHEILRNYGNQIAWNSGHGH